MDLEKEFTLFVEENKSTIYTVCYMFSKDADEVADLFQDTLINLWKSFEKFRGDCTSRTWVWRISLNTCISAKRKKRRLGERIPLSINVDLFDEREEDHDNRQIKILRERITRLAPFDRAIILLWLENMSYDEIAAIVGITSKNVSVRLHRIKEQLKNM